MAPGLAVADGQSHPGISHDISFSEEALPQRHGFRRMETCDVLTGGLAIITIVMLRGGGK